VIVAAPVFQIFEAERPKARRHAEPRGGSLKVKPPEKRAKAKTQHETIFVRKQSLNVLS
jgi:hypothetical protein